MDIQQNKSQKALLAELVSHPKEPSLCVSYMLELRNESTLHRLVLGQSKEDVPAIEKYYDVKTIHGLRRSTGLFGRLVTGKYHSSLISEAVEISHSILPLVREQAGFVAVVLCVRPDGTNFSLSIWENEGSAQANVCSGWWREQVDKFNAIYVAPPTSTSWSVNIV